MTTSETTSTTGPGSVPAPDPGSEWETVIGLEVHTELRTETKLFCGCRNAFGEDPNTNICPVCLGLPGSLPVLNRQAVDFAMRIGLALHCTVKPSLFHRKNYFYPDMPKDYQVSQYDEPINTQGWLELPNGRQVGIERAHLEEDTGKTTHVGGGGRIHDADYSLVDYNRAGVPLVEIVGAPDLRSSEDAKAYVDELRGILVATGASDGKMEEGSLRVDANVSVRRAGDTAFGKRCEIKNMNSLRSLGRAIDYEAGRQIALIQAGEPVLQETRHWNEADGKTHSMRSKEEAYDYRYFPEPDLVPLAPSDQWQETVRRAMPVLPAERRARVAEAAGVAPDADGVVTVVRLGFDPLVLAVADAGGDAGLALKRAVNEVAAAGDRADHLQAASFIRLVEMEAKRELTTAQAREVLKRLLADGGDVAAIVKDLGYEPMADDALTAVVDEVIGAHPAEWARYAGGEDKLSGFFIGKIKAATQGKADAAAASALLAERRA